MPNANESIVNKYKTFLRHLKERSAAMHQPFNYKAEDEDLVVVDSLTGSSIGIDSQSKLKQNDGIEQETTGIGVIEAMGLWEREKPVRKKRVRKMPEQMSDDIKQQNQQDILTSLVAEESPGRTYLVAIVFDKGDTGKGEIAKNTRQSIRCHHGVAFSEGYPYDQGSDSYIVNCVAQVSLGYISLAYQLTMPTVGEWRIRVPLPEVVVNRYLAGSQKSKIVELQAKYSQPRFVVQIMQMSGCET